MVVTSRDYLPRGSLGIPRNQRRQNPAEIDEDIFEQAVTKPGASTIGILAQAQPKPRPILSGRKRSGSGRVQDAPHVNAGSIMKNAASVLRR